MKALAVTEAILTVGMIVISATLLATQIPSMVNDMKAVMSKESVVEKSKELANLLSIATALPGEIKLIYSFPSEKVYDVTIKDGYVNVSSGESWATAKTLVGLDFRKDNAQTLTITKTYQDVIRVE